MKKYFIQICFMLFILSAVAVYAKSMGAECIVLDGGKQGNITFLHQLHQDRAGDCMICHDAFPQETGALAKAIESGQLKKKQVMNKTCLKCHRAAKKAGEAYGPVRCSGCHVK